MKGEGGSIRVRNRGKDPGQ